MLLLTIKQSFREALTISAFALAGLCSHLRALPVFAPRLAARLFLRGGVSFNSALLLSGWLLSNSTLKEAITPQS